MTLKKLILTTFRSYSSREFSFSPGINLVVGPNTAGKTNLLEAIYLLATGKSLRAGVESELIGWGGEWARVEGLIAENTEKYVDNAEADLGIDLSVSSEIPSAFRSLSIPGGEGEELSFKGSPKLSSEEFAAGGDIQLEVFIEANEGNNHTRKQFKVNGVKKGLGGFQGTLRVVVFSPESLRLILGRPNRRRSYLNRVLSSLDFNYFHTLDGYRKVVRNRNKLLWQIREFGIPKERLEFWDEKLFLLGGQLYESRKSFINRLNQKILELGLEISIVYEPSILDRGFYNERLPKEIAKATTRWGPHRDDFRFTRPQAKPDSSIRHSKLVSESDRRILNQVQDDDVAKGVAKDLAIFGSRGEQREAVFALCLAELEAVSEHVKASPGSSHVPRRPILLLDDIFSELDEAHRKRVLEVLPKQQTIITSAEPELLNSGLMVRAKVIELD